MSVTFSPPNITGSTPEAQLKSMQSWMFQLTEQLQYALNNLDTSNFSEGGVAQIVKSAETNESKEKIQSEFEGLKSIIIKTADTVKANYEEITESLESDYLAVSDFGEYSETNKAEIFKTASGMTQYFNRVESVEANVDRVDTSFQSYVKETNAYIRTGWLDQLDTYGVEIGEERVEHDDEGKETISFNRYATWTSSELAFWQNGVKLGYFKGDSLFVNGAIRIKNWAIDPSNGFTIKYV